MNTNEKHKIKEALANDTEYRKMSSFPSDYDFMKTNVRYVC